MIHPLLVDNLQKNDTLKLTNLLLLREFCFFLLVEFNSFLFLLLFQLVFGNLLYALFCHCLHRHDGEQHLI